MAFDESRLDFLVDYEISSFFDSEARPERAKHMTRVKNTDYNCLDELGVRVVDVFLKAQMANAASSFEHVLSLILGFFSKSEQGQLITHVDHPRARISRKSRKF
jgi:hypothetical protein